MLLYTLCPGCQTGFDVADLLRGKKMRCKNCCRPFTVEAAVRPPHLPAPVAFVRPKAPPVVLSAAAEAPPLDWTDRPARRLNLSKNRRSTGPNVGAWLGR